MKAEYRIEELNGKFTIETKVERIRFEGFFGQRKVTTFHWKGVTKNGYPIFVSRRWGISNHHFALQPFDTLEEAVAQIKEFRLDPAYYKEDGLPDYDSIPGYAEAAKKMEAALSKRQIGDKRSASQPKNDNTAAPPKKR